jgi:hypothetical protein
MIETILLATGAIVWLAIGAAVALWLPLAPVWVAGWLSYKSQRQLWVRDAAHDFMIWWTDHVLKPVFDPIIG